MSKNSKVQKQLKILKVVIVIVIILIIVLISSLLKLRQKNKNEEIKNANVVLTQEEIQEDKTNNEIEKLKQMTERNRIEYYITKFINYAENGEYEKAYNLLNREYRKTYFPTESSFRDYAKVIFVKMISVEYTNFERNGDIYVSWVTLEDSINGTKDSRKEFNFVVKENGYNDFELSFSKN